MTLASLVLSFAAAPALAQDPPEAPAPLSTPGFSSGGPTPASPETPVLPAPPVLPTPPELPVPPRLPILFVGSDDVDLSDPTEDSFAMGQHVVVSAPINDNAFLFAQDIRVDAPIGGDLFAFGETVRISAPIGGDVYTAGSEIVVEGDGAIGGNLVVGASRLRLEAPVAGDVDGGAGRVVLDAPILGDVDIEVGELVIQDGASVAGTLTYAAPHEAVGVEKLGAAEVRFTQQEEEASTEDAQDDRPSLLARTASFVIWTGWSYASKLLVGFALLALGGRAAGGIARSLLDQPARTFGVGFVVACTVPIASLLAMVLIVPLPLGVLALIALVLALYVAQVFTAQALGDLLLRRFRPAAVGSPYVSMAVGLVPIVLLTGLPWLGVVLWLFVSVAGIGAVWTATRRAATAT